MTLPKIDVQQRRLSQLRNDMESGKLQVPRFQREFVWPLTKTRALLDSMYKEFPIGTFFLWRAPADSPHLIRSLEELGIPEPKPGSEVWYILDGQQRLTSLYVTLAGYKVGSRDYGRISIDLETATCYDQNQEDGFDEDIFVYRSADNRRYVAVRDLVGERHFDIYDDIPGEWRKAFRKAHNILQETYPFSVVWIQEQELGEAIEIFQRINQAGQRLSRYDLICANVWRDDFDFRKRVELVNKNFRQSGFGSLHSTIYTQTFSLILKDRCTTVAELSLQTNEILRVWERAIRSLQLAVDFAVHNLGVKRAEYLPYRGLLVVLAYYFYHAPSSALSIREREALWNYFWRITLSERYGSTSPSRMAEDAEKLRPVMKGEETSFDYPSAVTTETVARVKMSSTGSALRNAFICMLSLKQPRSLKDGSPVNLADDFFSNLKQAERHHIFPVGYLKSQGWPANSVHQVPNFCFIPADLNREIGSRPPADYLGEYQRENPNFAVAADSHLLPVDGNAAVWNNDFGAFLNERAQRVAEELNRLVDARPDEFVHPQDAVPEGVLGEVDLMEIRLRDFIDHRLTAVLGPHYWDQAIPEKVDKRVQAGIRRRLAEHPYEDLDEFTAPRRKLDFCIVHDYGEIVLADWTQFEDVFHSKDAFERHLHAYRTLRNCVAHNREPTDIEQKNGEAAILWLGRVLDLYDEEVSTYSEADEENDDDLTQAPTIAGSAAPQDADIVEAPETGEVLAPVLGVPGRRPSQALQSVLEEIRPNLPEEAASRLVHFLERIIEWDWQIAQQTLGVAFRARALRTPRPSDPPKPMRTTVFFLRPGTRNNPHLVFPIAQPWVMWEGLDLAPFMDRLRALDCVQGWEEEVNLFLQENHSAEMFETLYLIVRDLVADMEQSLDKNG
jgi:hypothetical protein